MWIDRKHDIGWRLARLAVVTLLFAYCSAYGDTSRVLQETTASFWETNLVATVIGYTGQRLFQGVNIPVMDPSGGSARCVWLYSVAPTNYAGITFSLHSCGLDLLRVYPTNQLFVFPASVSGSNSCISNRYENEPIIPRQTVEEYCPYRTFEKWFPITDSQVQHWISDLTVSLGTCQERVATWRVELDNATDDKMRSSISNRLAHEGQTIHKFQRAIEDCKGQPRYFHDRIEWLKAQGLKPGK